MKDKETITREKEIKGKKKKCEGRKRIKTKEIKRKEEECRKRETIKTEGNKK